MSRFSCLPWGGRFKGWSTDGPGGASAPPEPPPSFPPSAIRTANFFVGRSRFKSFQKICPKGKFFEMVSWGGLGRLAPLRNLRYPCLAPRGGSGGLRPPGISVNYPCLASAAAVPCPRALPPIFFRPNFFVGIFSSEFFRRNFFVGIFLSEFFSKILMWAPPVQNQK